MTHKEQYSYGEKCLLTDAEHDPEHHIGYESSDRSEELLVL